MTGDNTEKDRPLAQAGSNGQTKPPTDSNDGKSTLRKWVELLAVIVGIVAGIIAVAEYLFPRSADFPSPKLITATSGEVPPVVVATELEAVPCSEEQSRKSLSSDAKTAIEFENRRSKPVELHWLNYEGQRESYGQIQPGEVSAVETYETHPWLVADTSKRCIAIFLGSKQQGRAVIQ
jgi:hypothetical protein